MFVKTSDIGSLGSLKQVSFCGGGLKHWFHNRKTQTLLAVCYSLTLKLSGFSELLLHPYLICRVYNSECTSTYKVLTKSSTVQIFTPLLHFDWLINAIASAASVIVCTEQEDKFQSELF